MFFETVAGPAKVKEALRERSAIKILICSNKEPVFKKDSDWGTVVGARSKGHWQELGGSPSLEKEPERSRLATAGTLEAEPR